MKSTLIKSFAVYGLFGTNDVHIKFGDTIKILIGENGLGKTQVLNLFYYTLTRDFFKLSEFNFEKLILTFVKGKPIEISKKNVDELVEETYKDPIVKDIIKEIGLGQFQILRNQFIHSNSNGNWHKIDEHLGFSNDKFRMKYPLNRVFRAFAELEIGRSKENNSILDKCKKEIIAAIEAIEIMYFPTFRRVEEDLHNFGYNDENLHFNQENTLIQFGMDDVQKKFNNIQNIIDKFLKEGLAEFTKDILNIVIDDTAPAKVKLEKISGNDIDIILSRVGNLLPQAQKEAVKNIVTKKQLKNPLSVYLLQKLIDIYEKQKEWDSAVKIFRDVCNKYLINKQIFYDESAIKIYVKSEITGEKIHLSKLSSGEKQIISIFSKIYLSDSGKRFMVLFDEPELSLSMTWQRQLLPDIVNSKKCDFLLAVTHSPFIFDNELDEYAVGLNEYVHPLKAAVAQ
jgi:predicted ATP-dependent endonuclease of OLD family